MTDLVNFRYRAFLSYSHHNVAEGTRLHAALESYRVPRDLAGRSGAYGSTPERLRPIFRDRFDLEAGHSLRDQVIEALKNSAALIVLCSPHSAKSSYVDEEIRLFKMQGRADRIYPIIVDGEPGDPERECFPKNLCRVIGADGVATGETEEPLAADIRPQGDGEELAKLKLIAGLLGVDLDDLRKREEIERRKQKQRLAMVAGGMTILAVCAVVFGIATWRLNGQLQQEKIRVEMSLASEMMAREEAQKRREEAEQRYAQALTSNLQLVTIAATFNSVIAQQRFSVMEVDAKLANEDFNRFLTGTGNDDAVWMRLSEVLVDFAKVRPPELRRVEQRLQEIKMPLQWVQHAETIMMSLARRSDKPEYKAELKLIRDEIARLGGQARKDPECPAPAPNAPMPSISVQQTAQQLAPCTPERLTPATAN